MMDQFLKRLPDHAKEERALVEAAFGIPVTLKNKASDIRGDSALSQIGQQQKIRELALGNPLAHLKQIRSRAAAMTADLSNLKRTFAPRPLDRADVVGFLEQQELRSFLRTLPAHEIMRMAEADDAVAESILLGNPLLSGISTRSEDGAPSQYDIVREGYLERKFGDRLQVAERRQEILDNVNAAIEIATRQFLNEAGLERLPNESNQTERATQ